MSSLVLSGFIKDRQPMTRRDRARAAASATPAMAAPLAWLCQANRDRCAVTAAGE